MSNSSDNKQSNVTFVQGAHLPPEQWKRPGKVEFPTYLTVQMSKRDALRTVKEIISAIENLPDDQNHPIFAYFYGRLEDNED